ncbi:MAG TPA: PEGA domain-containing protein [Nannocystaceae bacterium]|nr:PEGA domain-containing protein [Nannocystaceae bacterium]
MLHALALAPCLGWMSVDLSERPSIAVEPPTLTGRAVENQELFQREIDQAVAAQADVADPAEAAYRVRVQVQEDARDYAIRVEVLDAEGSSVAVAESSCDICSEAEAASQTGRELAALLSSGKLDVTTSVRFTSEPPGATVVLDGRNVGKTPIATSLEPGPHTVVYERDGYESRTRQFEAEAGEQGEVHVDLGGGSGTPAAPNKSLRRAAWIGGWVGIGVGVALLTTGIALLAVDGNEIKSDCDGANKDAFGHCRYRHKTTAGGAAATVLGVVVAGTGVGFVVWSRPNKGKQQLRANVGPGRVALTLRF